MIGGGRPRRTSSGLAHAMAYAMAYAFYRMGLFIGQVLSTKIPTSRTGVGEFGGSGNYLEEAKEFLFSFCVKSANKKPASSIQVPLDMLSRFITWLRARTVMLDSTGADHPRNNYTFAIIGCGQMGMRIACELLRRGCRVLVWDSNAFRCQSLHISVRSMLSSYRSIDSHAIDSLMKLFYTASGLAEIASSGCNFIIEAVPESLQIKRQIFTSIIGMLKANAIPPEDVLICSNTISIPVEHIVCGLDEMYSCRVMGLRFLHPVLFIDDVELTKHSRNTIDSIHSTTLMLKSMKLKPALRDSLSGRRLTSTDMWRYYRRFKSAQLTHLPEDIIDSSSFETKSQCIICLHKDPAIADSDFLSSPARGISAGEKPLLTVFSTGDLQGVKANFPME